MRLLYLTNGYPPRHTAGTENYTAGLARAMAAAGHMVEVVCGGDWEAGPRVFNGIETTIHDGVTVRRLNFNWKRGRDPNRVLFDNPDTQSVIARLLQDFRPDVVHLTSAYTLSASAVRAAKQADYPLVVTLTDFWFLCPQVTLRRTDGTLCDGQTTPGECLACMLRPSGAYQAARRVLPNSAVISIFAWASRKPLLARQAGLRGMALDMEARKRTLMPLLNQADAVIAPSRFLAEMYAANGLRLKARVIPYGHDLRWAEEVRPPKLGRPVVAGYAGRLTEAKGVHVLVEAAAQLAADTPLEVHIHGDPAQEPIYSQRLRRLAANVPRVKFMGKYGREALAAVFSSFDVVVVPSVWYENNPLVAQEAFAAGRPVVASDLGGMSEFVRPGEGGWLFAAGDARALADQLRAIAQAPEQIESLRKCLPRVRSMREELADLSHIYAELKPGDGSRS